MGARAAGGRGDERTVDGAEAKAPESGGAGRDNRLPADLPVALDHASAAQAWEATALLADRHRLTL